MTQPWLMSAAQRNPALFDGSRVRRLTTPPRVWLEVKVKRAPADRDAQTRPRRRDIDHLTARLKAVVPRLTPVVDAKVGCVLPGVPEHVVQAGGTAAFRVLTHRRRPGVAVRVIRVRRIELSVIQSLGAVAGTLWEETPSIRRPRAAICHSASVGRRFPRQSQYACAS